MGKTATDQQKLDLFKQDPRLFREFLDATATAPNTQAEWQQKAAEIMHGISDKLLKKIDNADEAELVSIVNSGDIDKWADFFEDRLSKKAIAKGLSKAVDDEIARRNAKTRLNEPSPETATGNPATGGFRVYEDAEKAFASGEIDTQQLREAKMSLPRRR